jgi:predicted amidohydrolase
MVCGYALRAQRLGARLVAFPEAFLQGFEDQRRARLLD